MTASPLTAELWAAIIAIQDISAQQRAAASTPFERALVDWDGTVEHDRRLARGTVIAMSRPEFDRRFRLTGRVVLIVSTDVFKALGFVDEDRLRLAEMERWEDDGGAVCADVF